MGIRIILVVVVAILGLNGPTVREARTIGEAFRSWVSARIADWDERREFDPIDAVVVAEPLESSTPIWFVAETSTSPVEPVALVSAEVVASPAELAVGLDLPRQPIALEVEVDREVEATAAIADAPSDRSLDAAFEVGQAYILAEFAADRIAEVARVKANETEIEPAPPIEAEAIAESRSLEIDENPYLGQTCDLNPRSNGAETASVEPVVPTSQEGSSKGQITNAVRLTREAVYAWSSLLHGPAVVTIGR